MHTACSAYLCTAPSSKSPHHIRSCIHKHAIPLPLPFLLYSRHCSFQHLRYERPIALWIHRLFQHLVALLLIPARCQPRHVERASTLLAQFVDHCYGEIAADNHSLGRLIVILRADVERRRLRWLFSGQKKRQLGGCCFGGGKEVYGYLLLDCVGFMFWSHQGYVLLSYSGLSASSTALPTSPVLPISTIGILWFAMLEIERNIEVLKLNLPKLTAGLTALFIIKDIFSWTLCIAGLPLLTSIKTLDVLGSSLGWCESRLILVSLALALPLIR